ncbi:TerC family protein [Desulforamulus aquiferis]|uniref:TerC family protein n=1 Tax=Desulforamulus aquiferis TaxID=1397668 RepID=A0AAW7ZC03_9FIRM|nr:TerC family protein [Desulforamulus aquiferis]MDO7786931.1 TerC family protein [Desulforamulus aquiferis]
MELQFLGALLTIIVIDIVLGGDNAIIIAMASKNLPVEQRKKAIIWGTFGAVAIRAALTVVALQLLKIPLLQFVGGLLLVWIALKLLKQDHQCDVNVKAGCTLREAIQTIIIADVVMGVDNVLAIAGAAHGSVTLVIMGLAISVPIIVWGSTLVLKLMDRYPIVTQIGAGVLAWTAGSMISHDRIINQQLAGHIPFQNIIIPALIVVTVLSIGNRKNLLPKIKRLSGGNA